MTEQHETAVSALQQAGPATGRHQHLMTARAVASENLIWVILGATFLYGMTVHGFLSSTNLINVAWSSVPMGCMVLGMFFVMLTGGLDLSLESVYGVAPVLGIVILNDYLSWLPSELALVIAVLAGLVAGLLNGLISVKLRVNPFLVTLVALLFWRGLVIFLIPEGIYNLPAGYTFVGGFRFFGVFPLAIVFGLLLFAVAWVVINRTSFGKAIYAIGSNEMAAYVAGINVPRVKIAVFMISGLLAGIGGLIEVGRIGAVVDDLGSGSIMMVLAGAILGGTSLAGGRGRLSGVLAAILELAVIDNVMNLIGVEPSARQMIFALILLGAIYLASFQEHRETVSA